MKISREIIEKLLRHELERGEKEFIDLFRAVEAGKITQEELRERNKTLQGYGVWWGSESSYSLGRMEINYVIKLEEGCYEILATCDMHYESSHVHWEENGEIPEYAREPKKAVVRMRVNDVLELRNSTFNGFRAIVGLSS